ncbi:MAG: ATP-binding protein [Nitrospirota bacterium]|jgi:two-component system sensor histidine kinase PilS (NtrC family)
MTEDSLVRKLKTLIAIRVFFVTVLLGTVFVFQIGYRVFPFPTSVLHLGAVLYGLSIAYALLLGRVDSRRLAHAQIVLDDVAVVALIFLTGGIESWFSSLMLVIVIAAATVLGRTAGYFNAIFLSILYGVLVDLQFYGLLPLPYDPLLTEKDFLYNIFSHMLGLYLTAYLMGYLVSRIETKETFIEDLTLFNKEVIENTPSGLFTTDLAGRILVFNKAAEDITGRIRAYAIGKNASQVFPFMKSLSEGARMEEVLEVGGKEKILGLTVSRMKDAKGRDTGFIGVFQDLTRLKRLAEEIRQKEKWATIGELSANMAHEIRNPLASLKGSIEMLRESSVSTEKKEKLMSIAISEMDRLNHIIGDFLTYSRPSALEVDRCDLSAILDKTLDLLRSKSSNGIVIKKTYSSPLTVSADQLKLEQVFLNLGLNALDAMPSGGSIEVGASRRGDDVEITFTDTGGGIPLEEQEKVFYPFHTTKAEGTGLGLSIARRIIEDHKGKVMLQSSPGAGTTFKIIMPGDHAEAGR